MIGISTGIEAAVRFLRVRVSCESEVLQSTEVGWVRRRRDPRLERPIGKRWRLAIGLSSLVATAPSRGHPAG